MKRAGSEGLEQQYHRLAPMYLGSLIFMGKVIQKTQLVISQMPSVHTHLEDSLSGNNGQEGCGGRATEQVNRPLFPSLSIMLPVQSERPPPPLLDGEKLYVVTQTSMHSEKGRYELSRKEPDGLYVSLDEILLKKLFLRLGTIPEQIALEYYVDLRFAPPFDALQVYIPIRMEFYLERQTFSLKYNSIIKKQRQQIEQEKERRRKNKEKGGKGVTARLNMADSKIYKLKMELCNEIANRQLIMMLFKLLGTTVIQPALVKPDLSQNEITLYTISKRFVSYQQRSKLTTILKMFDAYCSREKCRLFGRLLSNMSELQYFRDGVATFSRSICLPYLKKFLSEKELEETNKFEALVMKTSNSGYPVLGDFLMDYLTHDTILSKDLKELETRIELRQSFYNLRNELQKQFEEEDHKLDKRLKLNNRTYIDVVDGETKEIIQPKLIQKRSKKKKQQVPEEAPDKQVSLAELYGVDNELTYLPLAKYRRNMMRLLSRKNNNQAFQEFDEDIKNIREHEQPFGISTELMVHQRQALTWMKYREHLIPPNAVMLEGYKKDSIETERAIGAYQEHLILGNKTAIYDNHFTGCFSLKPIPWKAVSGGILAFEMGLGKTVSAFAIMTEPFAPRINTATQLYGRNLFITIPSMVPDEVENLLKKHMRPPVNYYIYDKSSRRLNVDLSQYDIVVASYRTVVSDFNDLSQDERFELYEDNIKLDKENLEESSDEEYNIQQPELRDEYIADPPLPARDYHNLYHYDWHRIIIDEAHHIRNRNTNVSEAVTNLKGKNRWCLTGSPILNDKTELYALCKFLKVDLFSDWEWWNHYLKKSKSMEEGFGILHKVLRPILLHRAKHSTDRFGNPIINLPARHNHVEYVQFDARQRKAYIAMETAFKDYIKLAITNQINHGAQKIRPFTLLLRLRQFCVNPFLSFRQRNEFNERDLADQAKAYFEMPIEEILEENQYSLCIVCMQTDEDLAEMKCGHMICEECLENSEDMVDPSLYDCETCQKREGDHREGRQQGHMELEKPPPPAQLVGVHSLASYCGSKLQKVIELAAEIMANGEKCIIFTMWIHVMEQLAFSLVDLGFNVVALHSKVKKEAKSQLLHNFKMGSLQGLVTSLRMCGEGLNLVEANNVIIVQPEWNPAVEEQGIDRVYRIGQLRVVNVYRLIVKNSIEEKMKELHEKKTHEAHFTLMNREFFQKKKYFKTLITLLMGE